MKENYYSLDCVHKITVFQRAVIEFAFYIMIGMLVWKALRNCQICSCPGALHCILLISLTCCSLHKYQILELHFEILFIDSTPTPWLTRIRFTQISLTRLFKRNSHSSLNTYYETEITSLTQIF